MQNGSFDKLTEDLLINPNRAFLLNGLNGKYATHVGVKSGRLALFRWSGPNPRLPIFSKSRRKWKYVLIPEAADSLILPLYQNRMKGRERIVEHQYERIDFLLAGEVIEVFCFNRHRFIKEESTVLANL